VRQVVGRATREIPGEDFVALRSGFRDVILDVGTGDGNHVLAVARRRPDALVVGLDADAERMRPTSARAAKKPARGGVPNAVFVWASVEQLPAELDGVSEMHVLMPWGSLLRSLVAPDPTVLARLAGACVAPARFLLTLNLHAWRPPVPEVGDTAEPTPASALAGLAPRYAAAGWRVQTASYLDDDALRALATSWTKRLGSSRPELAALAVEGVIDRPAG
jgi:16S rRNA (adenine(1408)-N(1))-methyltransferase